MGGSSRPYPRRGQKSILDWILTPDRCARQGPWDGPCGDPHRGPEARRRNSGSFRRADCAALVYHARPKKTAWWLFEDGGAEVGPSLCESGPGRAGARRTTEGSLYRPLAPTFPWSGSTPADSTPESRRIPLPEGCCSGHAPPRSHRDRRTGTPCRVWRMVAVNGARQFLSCSAAASPPRPEMVRPARYVDVFSGGDWLSPSEPGWMRRGPCGFQTGTPALAVTPG